MTSRDTWRLYFLTVAGWTFHPGYQKDASKKPTLTECAMIASNMQKLEEWVWQQSQQPPSEPEQES